MVVAALLTAALGSEVGGGLAGILASRKKKGNDQPEMQMYNGFEMLGAAPLSEKAMEIVKKKREEVANFNSNPMQRLGYSFGLLDAPAKVTGRELFGNQMGPLSPEQEMSTYLVNELNQPAGSVFRGLGGPLLMAPGNIVRSLL